MLASARLEVTQVAGRSAVTALFAEAPLKLLAPKNHGRAAWVYQSSLGGGFVGADALAVRVDVGEGAALFFGSQASSKVYRETDGRFTLDARVSAGGVLVSWPDPVVCFEGARLTQGQHVTLGAGASLLLVDALAAGRVARGERWAFTHLSSRLEVLDDAGRPLVREATRLSPEAGPLEARLSGVEALATVVFGGPAFAALGETVARALSAEPLRPQLPMLSVGQARGLWVLRAAAATTESLQEVLHGHLLPGLVAALDEDPFARKW
jgi:urease accessory protein